MLRLLELMCAGLSADYPGSGTCKPAVDPLWEVSWESQYTQKGGYKPAEWGNPHRSGARSGCP